MVTVTWHAPSGISLQEFTRDPRFHSLVLSALVATGCEVDGPADFVAAIDAASLTCIVNILSPQPIHEIGTRGYQTVTAAGQSTEILVTVLRPIQARLIGRLDHSTRRLSLWVESVSFGCDAGSEPATVVSSPRQREPRERTIQLTD